VAFAFHPFRADHLAHLELLSSYWLPLALLALHRWADTLQARWLVAASVALLLQALTCGYYFVYSAVLVWAWLLWFVPWRLPLRQYVALLGALAAPVLMLAPVLWRYHVAHDALGLSRTLVEIEQLSADGAAFLTAPERLSVWSWLRVWPSPEGALFPGITLLLVIGLAVVEHRRRRLIVDARNESTPRWAVWRRVTLALAALALLAAALPVMGLPLDLAVGPLRLSVSQSFKPFSVAIVLLLLVGLGSPAVRTAWRERRVGPFYLGVTVLLWVCAMGPTARLFGERVLYKPPYAWLMELPGFADELRAPARFAMLAALTLAMAAAVAFVRLSASWPPARRRTGLAVVLAGVLADGAVVPFPLVEPPAMLAMPGEVPADATVLELPMGVFEDAAAMYRATGHRHSVVNGLSGYQPPHVTVLRAALDDQQFAVIDALAPGVPLALFLDQATAARHWAPAVASATAARPLTVTDSHAVLVRPPVPAESWRAADADGTVAVASVASTANPDAIGRAVDGDPATVWGTTRPQQGDETVTMTLAAATDVTGVQFALGSYVGGFPRDLTISVSLDGATWREVWRGATVRQTMTAVLADPRLARVPIRFAAAPARFVRLAQTARANESGWVMAEVSVLR
jgi:hypothetical protein